MICYRHPHPVEGMAAVSRIKAKFVKLYGDRIARGTIEMQNQDKLQEEKISLFHLIKLRQRWERRAFTHVHDPVSGMQTTTRGIVNTFSSYLRRKYGHLTVDDECVKQMTEAGYQRLSDDWKEALETPLTSEELKGEGYKAPGRRQDRT